MAKESKGRLTMSKEQPKQGLATRTGILIDRQINRVRQSDIPRKSRAITALGIAKTAGVLCTLAEKVGPKIHKSE